MKTSKKGVALVTALMVTMIIIIMAGGLVFLTTHQQRLVNSQTANDRLFYAAEAGLTKAVKRLRILNLKQFTAPSSSDVAIISDLPVFDFNGTQVDITASWNSSLYSWTLSATANDMHTSQSCTIELDNIKSQAFTNNSMTVQEDMPYSVRFVGVKSGSEYQPNDMMLGNLFFGGRINIEADPIFKGKVTSSCKDLSIRTDNTVTEYDKNLDPHGLSSSQRRMHSSQFSNGIWDLTPTSESVNAMKARYTDKIFRDGYEGNSASVDNTSDVVATFEDVRNYTTRPSAIKGEPYVVQVGSNDNISVTIEEGYITVNPKPAAWTTNRVRFDDNQNTILFDGESTPNNRIAIRESVISGNLTVMSKNVDIEIEGDIKYKELIAPYNTAIASYTAPFMWANNATSASQARNGDNISALAKILQTGNASSMFGCVSENGNIWLGNDLCKNSNDIKDVTILSGAYYAPNGKFGIRVAGDNGDKLYGTISKKGSVDTQDGWYPGDNGGQVLTRVVVIGSAMMKSVGKFRQIKGELDETAAASGQNGYWYYYDRPVRYKQHKVKDATYGPDTEWVPPVYDKFGNLKQGTGIHKPVYHPAVYENILPLVVEVPAGRDSLWFGSNIASKKYDSTRGFEGAFCTDYRFSENGLFPAIFKPLKTSNGFVYNDKATTWSCTFK